MEKDKFITINSLIVPLALAAGVTMATQTWGMSHGGMRHYATDNSGATVKNSAAECWLTAGGLAGPQEACGDKMPEPEKMAEPPAPMPMPAPPPPADSDGDGVVDAQDKCPGTRAGAKVDQWGCEIIENLVIDLVEGEFEFDSAKLTPRMQAALDDLAAQIAASPGKESITVIGHTDSTGPEDYNQGLSERRARAAADYLIDRGMFPDLMTVRGMGETSPIADNGTREGRAKNRRVEIQTR